MVQLEHRPVTRLYCATLLALMVLSLADSQPRLPNDHALAQRSPGPRFSRCKVNPGMQTNSKYSFHFACASHLKLRYLAPPPPKHAGKIVIRLTVNGQFAGFLTKNGLSQRAPLATSMISPGSHTPWVEVDPFVKPGVTSIVAECLYLGPGGLTPIGAWVPSFEVESDWVED
jgi:hypothetical protein